MCPKQRWQRERRVGEVCTNGSAICKFCSNCYSLLGHWSRNPEVARSFPSRRPWSCIFCDWSQLSLKMYIFRHSNASFICLSLNHIHENHDKLCSVLLLKLCLYFKCPRPSDRSVYHCPQCYGYLMICVKLFQIVVSVLDLVPKSHVPLTIPCAGMGFRKHV